MYEFSQFPFFKNENLKLYRGAWEHISVLITIPDQLITIPDQIGEKVSKLVPQGGLSPAPRFSTHRILRQYPSSSSCVHPREAVTHRRDRQHAQRTPSSCAAVVLHISGFRGHKTPDPNTYSGFWIPELKFYLKRIKDLIQNLNSPILVILIHLLSKFKPVKLIQLSKHIGDIWLTKFSLTEDTVHYLPISQERETHGMFEQLPCPMAVGPRASSPPKEPNNPTHRHGGPSGSVSRTHLVSRCLLPSP